MDFEIKSQVTELKAVQEGKNFYIEGLASKFNIKDSYNDIVLAGAFLKTLVNDFKRIRFCWQHEMDDVIGKIIEAKEIATGLFFRAKVSNTTLGKDVIILVQDEAINEISFQYKVKDYYIENDIRYITEVELIEISIVTRAANPQATITSTEIKSEKKEIKDYTNVELVALKKEVDTEYNKRIINLI